MFLKIGDTILNIAHVRSVTFDDAGRATVTTGDPEPLTFEGEDAEAVRFAFRADANATTHAASSPTAQVSVTEDRLRTPHATLDATPAPRR